MANSLQNIPQNKYIPTSYYDIVNNETSKTDDRSGDEIVADIIIKCGLKFREE